MEKEIILKQINNKSLKTSVPIIVEEGTELIVKKINNKTTYPFSIEKIEGATNVIKIKNRYNSSFSVEVEKQGPDGEVTLEGEILDSWDTIIANIDNGTYSTKYSVGNYKPLDLGDEGIINMQIVAMDDDELADGSGYAPLTFLAMRSLKTEKSHDAISTYINTNVKSLIPVNVRDRINAVKKYSVASSDQNYITTENLWIPSAKEVNAKSFGYMYETEGAEYNSIFKDNSSRRLSNSAWYWLRSKISIYSSYYYQYVADGDVGDKDHTNVMAIRLGFCLGLEPAYTV